MLSRLKSIIRNIVPVGRLSYSQEGEDLVLARILEVLKSGPGFFVDIGAHHPVLLSNTYYFYRRGWRGINVDPLPGTKKLFRRMRPRDITLECGIGSREGVLKYFMFNVPALNTFSELEAKKKEIPPYRITATAEMPVMTLKALLDRNLPKGAQIDFMSIDVEGLDHDVVASNDWSLYRPRVVMVELLNTSLQDFASQPTAQILLRENYRPMAKTFHTVFFVADEVFPQDGPEAAAALSQGEGS